MQMINGQMMLFDLLGGLSVQTSQALTADAGPKEPAENYLVRGEQKILSLLRAANAGKKFEESSFLELFNRKTWENSTDRGKYIMDRIKRGMIRPVFEGHSVFNADVEREFRELFCGYDNFDIQPTSAYEDKVYRCMAKDDSAWSVAVYSDMLVEPVVLGGCRISSRIQRNRWRVRSVQGGYVHISDWADYFAEMVFLCQTKKYLKDYFAACENVEESVVYRRLKVLADNEIDAVVRNATDHVITVRPEISKSPFATNLLKGAGLRLEEPEKSYEAIVGLASLTCNLLLSDEVTKEDFSVYGSMFATHVYSRVAADVFGVLLDDYSEEKQAEEYRRNLSETYAKSFMTKKNIPRKIVAAMEASKFNDTFGYVEFDEECDIEKLDAIYWEFHALADFINLDAHKDVSLRFRKLGKHKASGLYYPAVKCLCVDVRSPSTFAHELFHMLDYEHGELSRTWNFQKVKDLYKAEFNRLVTERGTKFNGKYDKEYYFQSTEIFASCGEMYLTRICGIDNSLVIPETESVAYPWTEELEGAIREYFDVFLCPKIEVLRAAG